MRKDVFERMKLMRKDELEPNFAELARRYECDYRTVKRYFDSPLDLNANVKKYRRKLINTRKS